MSIRVSPAISSQSLDASQLATLLSVAQRLPAVDDEIGAQRRASGDARWILWNAAQNSIPTPRLD